MAIFCIYVQIWGVKFVLPDSPTWTSQEVGINEDLQVITYIYIGVISHNPLIHSPLIHPLPEPVGICPKFWGKRAMSLCKKNVMQPRRVCSGTSSAVLTIAVLTVNLSSVTTGFFGAKNGSKNGNISQMPPEGMEYLPT